MTQQPSIGCRAADSLVIMDTELDNPAQVSASLKEAALAAWLQRRGPIAVGFSGGVDSAYLAVVARRTLGADGVLAIIGRSASYPAEQWSTARGVADAFDVAVLELDTDELERSAHTRPTRAIAATSASPSCGASWCLPLGSADSPPWSTARTPTTSPITGPAPRRRKSTTSQSPLAELGFAKAEIRAASRALGLPTWQQPSSPCLSSRIPYGTGVTRERLAQVERAESALRALGIEGDLRVRYHDDLARVELAPAVIASWLQTDEQRSAPRRGARRGIRACGTRPSRIPLRIAQRAARRHPRMTDSNDRGDRTGRNAAALASAIAELGIACDVEARGGLVLLLPAPESVSKLAEEGTRRAALALARQHGFTHVAIELPNERRKADPDPDAPLLRD